MSLCHANLRCPGCREGYPVTMKALLMSIVSALLLLIAASLQVPHGAICNKKKVCSGSSICAHGVRAEQLAANPLQRYAFKVKVSKNPEYSSAILNLTGTAKIDGKEVGSATGYLIKRPSNQFYFWCDSISSEVQECAVMFFTRTGALQKKFHKQFDASENVDAGAYLHITEIMVDEDHRGKDVGLRLMKEMLDKTKAKWSIAMLQPSHHATVKISRHFARLGFKQCDTHVRAGANSYWYLLTDQYTGAALSKEETRGLPVVLPTPEVVLSPVNEKIVALVREMASQPPMAGGQGMPGTATATAPSFGVRLQELVSEGGNVNEARALHMIVAANRNDHIGTLRGCGADMNHPDETGNTPLHIAAAVGNVGGVACLLSLGARKSAKTHAGLTPAQLAREQVKNLKAFAQTFGLPYKPNEVDQCIEVLRNA